MKKNEDLAQADVQSECDKAVDRTAGVGHTKSTPEEKAIRKTNSF